RGILGRAGDAIGRHHGRRYPADEAERLQRSQFLRETLFGKAARQRTDMAATVAQYEDLSLAWREPGAAGPQFGGAVRGAHRAVVGDVHQRSPAVSSSTPAPGGEPAMDWRTRRLSSPRRPWKKWPVPGTTTTGSASGRAQSSTAASGTTSSVSPWMTRLSAGTG